jgi:ankyrin repeat protein
LPRCGSSSPQRHRALAAATSAQSRSEDSDGESALEIAIRIDHRSNEDVALLLIRAGAPLDDVKPSCLCVLAGVSTTAVQVLMDHNVAISDLRDYIGQTPLHIATGYAPSDAVLLSKLVDCGVDLDAISGGSHYATCSAYAIVADSVDALRFFLLRGANVDGAGWHGGVLLHDMIYVYSYECVILLLAAGADVTARDREGRTACVLALASAEFQPLMPFLHAMLAAGADLDAADPNGETPRQVLTRRQIIVDPSQVEAARREIAKTRLDFVRTRALEVCVGLQPLQLDALQMCEILLFACGPLAPVIAFHHWWKIATTVKHFKSNE